MDRTQPSPGFDPRFEAWEALRRPIWLFDPHRLKGVYANPPALRLWGARSPEELLSRDFSQMSPAALARTQRLTIATADGSELSERWTFYPNGEPVTVQATISTFRLADGRPVLLFEAATADVGAEERRAVEALRHTSTLITLFDLDGGALFANPAAYAAYGSAEHPFAARFADPARCAPLLDQALAGETVAEVCETITLAGPRWHHLDARRVTDPVTGALGVILSERDVTERVEAERARAAAEQKAAMAEARQRFLSDMSHELRTPLNAVIGFSSLLKDADLPCGAGEQAEHIHASGRRLLDVVEEMIRLAESGDWSAETTLDPTFPAPDAAPGPEAACAAAGQGPRILYVDDNATNRALVTAMLGAQGLTCQTANDGAQGLEVARTGGWDLILMDIQMPVMDGVAATRAIRRLPDPIGATPIVAVTANTLAEQLAQYAAAGLDDVIAKPIDMATLFAKVAIWIDAGTKRGVGGCGADRDAVEG